MISTLFVRNPSSKLPADDDQPPYPIIARSCDHIWNWPYEEEAQKNLGRNPKNIAKA